jgi:hypothetical protein
MDRLFLYAAGTLVAFSLFGVLVVVPTFLFGQRPPRLRVSAVVSHDHSATEIEAWVVNWLVARAEGRIKAVESTGRVFHCELPAMFQAVGRELRRKPDLDAFQCEKPCVADVVAFIARSPSIDAI